MDKNITLTSTIIQNQGVAVINGERIEFPKGKGNNVTVNNNNLYVDGKQYNFKTKEWKTTIKAIWNYFF